MSILGKPNKMTSWHVIELEQEKEHVTVKKTSSCERRVDLMVAPPLSKGIVIMVKWVERFETGY